jgi:hypothetical protein
MRITLPRATLTFSTNRQSGAASRAERQSANGSLSAADHYFNDRRFRQRVDARFDAGQANRPAPFRIGVRCRARFRAEHFLENQNVADV